jgi:hypothetical protein
MTIEQSLSEHARQVSDDFTVSVKIDQKTIKAAIVCNVTSTGLQRYADLDNLNRHFAEPIYFLDGCLSPYGVEVDGDVVVARYRGAV